MSPVPTLADIVGTFKGFFSRGFWFGNFLPVAIFAAVHLVIAWLALPNVPLGKWVATDASSLTYFPVTFAALVALSYAAAPLVPLMRGLLDGSLLPAFLHDALRKEHLIEARPIRRKINDAFDLFNQLDRLNSTQTSLIWKARGEGNVVGRITNRPSIEDARGAIKLLVERFDAGARPGAQDLARAAALLIEALQANDADLANADLDGGAAQHDPAARAAAQRLDEAERAMMQLLDDAAADARHEYLSLRARYSRIAYDNPQSTLMADTRILVEKYCADSYGVEFDYIWPRLQLVLPAKGDGEGESFGEKLSAAGSQIDFSVLSLALSLTVPLGWLPYLAFTAPDPILFLAIAGAAPLVIAFFYRVAVESQIAFGEVMKAAIDNYRFDLLGAHLRQALPATLSDERELWGRLQKIGELPSLDLVYRHTKPPG